MAARVGGAPLHQNCCGTVIFEELVRESSLFAIVDVGAVDIVGIIAAAGATGLKTVFDWQFVSAHGFLCRLQRDYTAKSAQNLACRASSSPASLPFLK